MNEQPTEDWELISYYESTDESIGDDIDLDEDMDMDNNENDWEMDDEQETKLLRKGNTQSNTLIKDTPSNSNVILPPNFNTPNTNIHNKNINTPNTNNILSSQQPYSSNIYNNSNKLSNNIHSKQRSMNRRTPLNNSQKRSNNILSQKHNSNSITHNTFNSDNNNNVIIPKEIVKALDTSKKAELIRELTTKKEELKSYQIKLMKAPNFIMKNRIQSTITKMEQEISILEQKIQD